MAPKLTPDNLVLPDQYVWDLDRNFLDDSIFPLVRHSGTLAFTPNHYSKKYTPAPPLPTPYSDDRFITDIRVSSHFDFRKGMTKYIPAEEGNEGVEIKHYLGNSTQNRLEIESVVNGIKTLISEIGATRKETRYPGGEVEIITLGTGSAIPNICRNGTCKLIRKPLLM